MFLVLIVAPISSEWRKWRGIGVVRIAILFILVVTGKEIAVTQKIVVKAWGTAR
jgi:hypothetical protein